MKLFLHVAFLMLFGLPFFASAQTTPLRILEIPKPYAPKDAGTLDVIDTFLFKVEFLASGKIGKVDRISGTHKELAQLATEATKRIKFEPKMTDGVPVRVARIVRYSYSYDGGWQTEPKPAIYPQTPQMKMRNRKGMTSGSLTTLDFDFRQGDDLVSVECQNDVRPDERKR